MSQLLLPQCAQSRVEQLREILRELHAFAAALEKALAPLRLSRHHWHVVDVRPDLLIAANEPMAWHVQMQFANTKQTYWEYITATEIFAYRLRIAMARDNHRVLKHQQDIVDLKRWSGV